MALFLVLSPFAILSAMLAVASAEAALFTAAAAAFSLVLADIWRGRSLKLLQIGTTLLFATIGLYVVCIDRALSGIAIRMIVDTGMLALALLSLALRFPFTIQYARETVDADIASRPEFRRANYILTWAWTVAFVVMLIANLAVLYAPGLPLWSDLAAAFAARNITAWFTQWYSERLRTHGAAERARLVPSSVGGDLS